MITINSGSSITTDINSSSSVVPLYLQPNPYLHVRLALRVRVLVGGLVEPLGDDVPRHLHLPCPHRRRQSLQVVVDAGYDGLARLPRQHPVQHELSRVLAEGAPLAPHQVQALDAGGRGGSICVGIIVGCGVVFDISSGYLFSLSFFLTGVWKMEGRSGVVWFSEAVSRKVQSNQDGSVVVEAFSAIQGPVASVLVVQLFFCFGRHQKTKTT